MTDTAALTQNPRVAEAIEALAATGWAAEFADADWRLVWVSDDLRFLLESSGAEDVGIGLPFAAARNISVVTEKSQRAWAERHVPYMLYDTGRDVLRGAGEVLGDVAESAEPAAPPPTWTGEVEWVAENGRAMDVRYIAHRVHDADGQLLGTSFVYGASLRARLLAYVARGSGAMFERMVRLARPSRREAAILFADLQSSGDLSRRLPSAAYFELLSELDTAIDEVVIESLGIVGKHAGDGVTAFFLSDDAGSASGAARSAIVAARAMVQRAEHIAECLAEESNGLFGPDDVRLNVGVHWGATLYMGQVITGGRLEVTALGDEVNECCRIQETARDGALLASKPLLERLSAEDADALHVNPDRTAYRKLADISSATEKAVRDAGGLAVCKLAPMPQDPG